MSNEQKVLELVVYRLNEGVTEAQYREAYDELSRWVEPRPGFVSRDVLRAEREDQWIELVWWTNKADAEQAAADAATAPECAAFFGAVHLDSLLMVLADPAAAQVLARAAA